MKLLATFGRYVTVGKNIIDALKGRCLHFLIHAQRYVHTFKYLIIRKRHDTTNEMGLHVAHVEHILPRYRVQQIKGILEQCLRTTTFNVTSITKTNTHYAGAWMPSTRV